MIFRMTQLYKSSLQLTLIALFILTAQACSTEFEPGIDPGASSFTFDSYEPLQDKPIEVYTYRPEGDFTQMPILFVMHGTLRNADTYRDNWIDIADEYGVLIVTPEFNSDDFPGARGYNLGGMFDGDGNPVDEASWAYSLIEPIFDEVLERTNSAQERYDIFGHSAGAQFTHRFFLFKEDLRTNHVIAANAGWYTLPDFETEFPYGMENTAMDTETLVQRLESRLMLQLGEEDNDPNHSQLRTSDNAMVQGDHRFARGHHFLETAQQIADDHNTELGWFIRTVPGVGHNNAQMALDVADYLFGDE